MHLRSSAVSCPRCLRGMPGVRIPIGLATFGEDDLETGRGVLEGNSFKTVQVSDIWSA